jgi:hypothetical protein
MSIWYWSSVVSAFNTGLNSGWLKLHIPGTQSSTETKTTKAAKFLYFESEFNKFWHFCWSCWCFGLKIFLLLHQPYYRYDTAHVDDAGLSAVTWRVIPTPADVALDINWTVDILHDGWVIEEPSDEDLHFAATLLRGMNNLRCRFQPEIYNLILFNNSIVQVSSI